MVSGGVGGSNWSLTSHCIKEEIRIFKVLSVNFLYRTGAVMMKRAVGSSRARDGE